MQVSITLIKDVGNKQIKLQTQTEDNSVDDIINDTMDHSYMIGGNENLLINIINPTYYLISSLDKFYLIYKIKHYSKRKNITIGVSYVHKDNNLYSFETLKRKFSSDKESFELLNVRTLYINESITDNIYVNDTHLSITIN